MSFQKCLRDPYRMRVEFPELWARYLRESPQFRGDPALVQRHFAVTFQAALNWLEARGRATGDKVAQAAAEDPEGFAAAMGSPPKGRAA